MISLKYVRCFFKFYSFCLRLQTTVKMSTVIRVYVEFISFTEDSNCITTVLLYSFSVSHMKYLSIIYCFHFSVNSLLNCYFYRSLFLLPCSHHLLFLLWTLRAAVGLYSTFKALHPLYSSKYTVGEQDSRLFSTLILGGYIFGLKLWITTA